VSRGELIVIPEHLFDYKANGTVSVARRNLLGVTNIMRKIS